MEFKGCFKLQEIKSFFWFWIFHLDLQFVFFFTLLY